MSHHEPYSEPYCLASGLALERARLSAPQRRNVKDRTFLWAESVRGPLMRHFQG